MQSGRDAFKDDDDDWQMDTQASACLLSCWSIEKGQDGMMVRRRRRWLDKAFFWYFTLFPYGPIPAAFSFIFVLFSFQFHSLVCSETVESKQETSCTVILPPTVSVLWFKLTLGLIWATHFSACCYWCKLCKVPYCWVAQIQQLNTFCKQEKLWLLT